MRRKTSSSSKNVSWLDDYNGVEPRRTYLPGLHVPELKPYVQKLLEVLYPDRSIRVKFVAVVHTGRPEIVVQTEERVYNEYGSYVGTEKSWTTLRELVEQVEEKLRQNETALKECEKIVEKIKRVLSE